MNEGADTEEATSFSHLGPSSQDVVVLDRERPAFPVQQPQQRSQMQQPQPVVQASWRVVDHIEGYTEQWMNIVGQEVWDDSVDWMEYSVPCLLSVTSGGGRQSALPPDMGSRAQQLGDFCSDICRNAHRARRGAHGPRAAAPARRQAAGSKGAHGGFPGQAPICCRQLMLTSPPPCA